MKTCRKGKHQYEGRQCPTCKAAWMKANDPHRGQRINAKRHSGRPPRGSAVKFGVRSARVVSLDALGAHLKPASDGQCPGCGGPTAWGWCAVCTPDQFEYSRSADLWRAMREMGF